MPSLLDLPDEILSQIACFATFTSDTDGFFLPYRTCFPTHWWTCKRWYNMVLAIFYEGLLRSGRLFLSYIDLDHFPGNQTHLYQYYSQKLEKLSLRLHGQPSRHISLQPFFDNSFKGFSDDSELDSAADTDSDSASHASSADDSDDSTVDPVDSAKYRRHVLSTWKDDLAGRLRVFSDFVAKCELLHELAFQAYYGFNELSLPQWNYLDCGAMEYFVLRLPHNLKYLTLDLAGTNVVSSYDSTSEHLCPSVARCILNVENVRLRLRHACPSVFGIKSIHSSTQQRRSQRSIQRSVKYVSRGRGRYYGRRNPQRQQRHFANIQNGDQVPGDSVNQQQLQFVMHDNSRTVGTSRLKSLVLRLSLPHFLADNVSEFPGPCNVQQCQSFQDVRLFGLSGIMALAARHVLGLEPGIGSLKISFRMPRRNETDLYAFDCVPWTLNTMDQGISCFEDDGEEWEDWENNTDVVITDIPTPAELSSMAYNMGVLRPAESIENSDDEWEDEPDVPQVAQVDPDDEWTDESEEDDDDGFNDPCAAGPEYEDDIYGMSAFADVMYPGAAAAGLGIGDIMDLMEHDMIFGSDHTPF
ncbi:MAG: hypothetical protein Q9226_005245 [Calogaya cf. arnoldii]